jgi:triosephosphate isomerase (TIM)
MRKKFIAGNWKMHKLRSETRSFFDELRDQISDASVFGRVDVAFGVPATLFDEALKARPQGVKILAQNCHFEPQGAFTGELSTAMLQDAKVHGSIIGHSERRQYYAETSQAVGKKWDALVKQGLLPCVCVGETRPERDSGRTVDVIRQQIDDSLSQVAKTSLTSEFIIAYEPVWAIGTGLTATPQMAQEVHQFIRAHLSQKVGHEIADRCRILYGGSMNAANAKELLSMPDIDGGLVGGASLKAVDFSKIILAASV